MDVVTLSWKKFCEQKYGPFTWVVFSDAIKTYFVKEHNASVEYIHSKYSSIPEDIKIKMPQDQYVEFCLKWL